MSLTAGFVDGCYRRGATGEPFLQLLSVSLVCGLTDSIRSDASEGCTTWTSSYCSHVFKRCVWWRHIIIKVLLVPVPGCVCVAVSTEAIRLRSDGDLDSIF